MTITQVGHIAGRAGLLPAEARERRTRMSMLSARIHAGNSSSIQATVPAATSSTSALARPTMVSHRATILVWRAMVTVVSVNTAAIRIA